MGKTVYLTDFEIELIELALDPWNRSYEDKEDEEERGAAADNVLRKLAKK